MVTKLGAIYQTKDNLPNEECKVNTSLTNNFQKPFDKWLKIKFFSKLINFDETINGLNKWTKKIYFFLFFFIPFYLFHFLHLFVCLSFFFHLILTFFFLFFLHLLCSLCLYHFFFIFLVFSCFLYVSITFFSDTNIQICHRHKLVLQKP